MGSLSLIEGPRQRWLPAPAPTVLVPPAPLLASLCVHSEECTQPKFLRDLFLLAGKGRDEAGCPCPWPRKWQRNPVGPGWSGPGAYYTWDPILGAGVPRACCKDTVSCSRAVLVGEAALEGDNSPQRPHVCPLQAQSQFCSECNAPGQAGEHWSHPGTRSRVQGDKVKEGWCFAPHLLLSGLLQCLLYRMKPRSTTESGIVRHGPFSLG